MYRAQRLFAGTASGGFRDAAELLERLVFGQRVVEGTTWGSLEAGRGSFLIRKAEEIWAWTPSSGRKHWQREDASELVLDLLFFSSAGFLPRAAHGQKRVSPLGLDER